MAEKLRKKKRRVEEDDEPEQLVRNGKITIARTIKRSEVPEGRAPGQRNPEYEKLVKRLIRLEPEERGVVIPVESKKKKVQIREGVRKPLRVRGYDLTAVTDFDDELGEVLILYATKRETEEPEDEEGVEFPEPVAVSTRRKRKVVRRDDDEDEEDEE